MSSLRPTGIYRVKLKDKEAAPPDGITVIEWQSYSEEVVYFGSEEYGTADDIEFWYEMIAPIKDWSQ